MRYQVKCLQCGATWWQRGSFEPDTNAVELNDADLPEGQCNCGAETEIIDEEGDEEDD